MPLFFQAVLLDSPAQAGLRMVLRSLATPIGSFLAGIGMTRHFSLSMMTQAGMFTLAVGTASLLFIQVDSKELSMMLLMIPNFGAGVAFPSSLFQFINIFAKSGTTSIRSAVLDANKVSRPYSRDIYDVCHALSWICVGCCGHFGDCSRRLDENVTHRPQRQESRSMPAP